MNSIYTKSRAKINLALDVLGKRNDGYHDLRMIMQTLSLYDDLIIRKINRPKLVLTSNLPYLPTGEKNLVYKAADYMRKQYGLPGGLQIQLEKRIPVAAGLGGGSSNCAHTLLALRKLYDLPVSDEELRGIGKQFGADVPFFIMEGTALAEGIGELLTPLPSPPLLYVLLAKPNISVSTAYVYQNLSLESIKKRPDIEALISALSERDSVRIAREMGNVLESVTEVQYPIIKTIKKIMISKGALGAMMSGSGPTVFGLFDKKRGCFDAMRIIRNHFSSVREVYMTEVYNPKGASLMQADEPDSPPLL